MLDEAISLPFTCHLILLFRLRAMGAVGMEKKGGTRVLEVRSSGDVQGSHCKEFYFMEIES